MKIYSKRIFIGILAAAIVLCCGLVNSVQSTNRVAAAQTELAEHSVKSVKDFTYNDNIDLILQPTQSIGIVSRGFKETPLNGYVFKAIVSYPDLYNSTEIVGATTIQHTKKIEIWPRQTNIQNWLGLKYVITAVSEAPDGSSSSVSAAVHLSGSGTPRAKVSDIPISDDEFALEFAVIDLIDGENVYCYVKIDGSLLFEQTFAKAEINNVGTPPTGLGNSFAYYLSGEGNLVLSEGKGLSVRFIDGGSLSADRIYDADSVLVEKPSTPTKNYSKFEGWFADSARTIPFDFDTPIIKNTKIYGKWSAVPGAKPYMSFAEGNYTLGDSKLTKVNGKDRIVDWTENMGESGMIEYQDIQIGLHEGEQSLKYTLHSWNVFAGKNSVEFDTPIAFEGIDGLIIRMYAHLSMSDAYYTNYAGVRLFSTEAEGVAGQGVMLPHDIEQDTWTDLYLNKNEASKLVNSNGLIEGFQIGSHISYSSSDNYLLYYYKGAYVLIESVFVIEEASISFDADGGMVNGQSIYTDTAYTGLTYYKNVPMPVRQDKVFCGWMLEDSTLYDFNSLIYGDVHLKAIWADAEDISNHYGLYMKGATRVQITASGVQISNLNAHIQSYAVTSDGKLAITTAAGLTIYDLSDYNLIPSYTVTYKITDTDNEFVLVEQNSKIEPFSPTRGGYIFRGWLTPQQDLFDFDSSVTQNMTLTADWEYDEISNNNYTLYEGNYYCADSKQMLVLSGDKTAALSTESFSYVILTSGELVLNLGGTTSSALISTIRIIYQEKEFYKLTSFIVNFETYLPESVEPQNINGGSYKATKPEDLHRKDYVFEGWTTADGTLFDFDTVITSSMTLYAKWSDIGAQEPTEPSPPVDTTLKLVAIIAGLTVSTLAAITFGVLSRKKRDKRA